MPRQSSAPNRQSALAIDDSAADFDEPIPPFFNTTFSTHRVSPLFVGPEKLTRPRLDVLGRRLRDTLVGDVVRGIQIGLESVDTPTGQVGPLRSVSLRWFRATDVLGDETGQDEDGDDADGIWQSLSESQKQGLWIEIRHENASYIALLLPGVDAKNISKAATWQMQQGDSTNGSGGGDDHFVHLPLLLLRMPLPLKNVIGEWLSSTFDCRVSKLALGTKTLVNIWEDWIRTMGVRSRGADFVITLAFNAPLPEPTISADDDMMVDDENMEDSTKPGLRSLEITIQPQDLRRFIRAGKGLTQRPRSDNAFWENDIRERRRLAGGSADDGWAWLLDGNAVAQPFTDALARYMDHHLALNVFHPSVRIVQISCGGFVLASNRLKIVRHGDTSDELSRAAWMFVTRLGRRISGEALPAIFT